MNTVHEPVLLYEVIQSLTGTRDKVKGERVDSVLWLLDGTLGGAGHSLAIVKALNGNVNIIGLDRDAQAIERARMTLQGKGERVKGEVILEKENFRNLDKVLAAHDITGVDLILLDLGISSDELENSGRGFTFQKDEPLLMTMGEANHYPFTAETIVNDWDEEVIANIIFGYGEERFARRIAQKIIQYRTKTKIKTSGELAEIIKSAVPAFYRRGKTHPATKTFQALRIAVNDELNALKEGLVKGFAKLNKGGRMAVISFHSLEDRIVKDFFKLQGKEGAIIITKKPITASEGEVAENPRSRSAKMRVVEKA